MTCRHIGGFSANQVAEFIKPVWSLHWHRSDPWTDFCPANQVTRNFYGSDLKSQIIARALDLRFYPALPVKSCTLWTSLRGAKLRILLKLSKRANHTLWRSSWVLPTLRAQDSSHLRIQLLPYRPPGLPGKDYFRTTVSFPTNFVTLLAVIWLDGEHYFSAGTYTPNNIKLYTLRQISVWSCSDCFTEGDRKLRGSMEFYLPRSPVTWLMYTNVCSSHSLETDSSLRDHVSERNVDTLQCIALIQCSSALGVLDSTQTAEKLTCGALANLFRETITHPGTVLGLWAYDERKPEVSTYGFLLTVQCSTTACCERGGTDITQQRQSTCTHSYWGPRKV